MNAFIPSRIELLRSQLAMLRGVDIMPEEIVTSEPVLEEIVTSEPVLRSLPPLTLLRRRCIKDGDDPMEASVIESKFAELGIHGKVESIRRGPVVTRYEVRLAPGQKISEVRSVKEDLEITLSNKIRLQVPIPGTALIGLEVVNNEAAMIGLRSVLGNAKGSIPLAIGVDTVGSPKVIDLTKMPHLLIAGQTGSGKSVCLNSIILSILFTKTPEECQLILVDPKRVEMTAYRGIPHLRQEVVTEPEDALEVFTGLVAEMENRFRTLSEAGVRNIDSYNEKAVKKMPYIVTIVDEMADLMMTADKQLEKNIVRIAQLARAVGIHLVLATQKPLVKVITGLIKSNMPSRISFLVSSKGDSRVILDCNGAEKLAGRGDMLMQLPGMGEPERFHGAWVSDDEIAGVVKHIKGV